MVKALFNCADGVRAVPLGAPSAVSGERSQLRIVPATGAYTATSGRRSGGRSFAVGEGSYPAATRARVSSRYAVRVACRAILPLDVHGIVSGAMSTKSCSRTLCCSDTA